MSSRIILKQNKREVFVDEFEVDLSTDSINEQVNKFNFDNLQGREKEICLDGVKVYLGSLVTQGVVQLELNYDTPFLMINFELEGDTWFTPVNRNPEKLSYGIKCNEYNFFYLPKMEGTLTYKSNKRKYFSLFFTEEYVKDMFKSNFEDVGQRFGKALKRKKPFILFEQSRPIPNKIHEIIEEIKCCLFEKQIKEVYLQSKIMEIFSIVFSQFNIENNKSKSLKKTDLAIINEAEKLIANDFDNIFTLDEVAKKIGTNKFKLKRDFKKVNGETVFEYQSRLRMEKAKLLLLDTDTSIGEVAYNVGYKNPQHFTNAFKKRFSYPPRVFRNKLLLEE